MIPLAFSTLCLDDGYAAGLRTNSLDGRVDDFPASHSHYICTYGFIISPLHEGYGMDIDWMAIR
ncbi:uncharacterized protein BO95DRAFT_184572 [Aspergillus brunneoviolaceus CBS 621.78]|uniref:Uncharacterized protein n=1 Tax=Aspergillus brunneoviolaceus CBS 621.78 TaxID=1450534 RepID=A0ACD1G4F1_9EURO|nr:hypothetical protein BO95DRAFT_184572 [Aspergillus brunneoviolaceus CBS 621.78]RAH44093.1 hypothetical protein BO95DRAFT_184572 [Aspergillus brunneoviolaceus CBS 621.78]